MIDGQAIESVKDGPRGRKYATTGDGRRWTKTPVTNWVIDKGYTPPSEVAKEDQPLKLFLTIHTQLPGEPQHWSLFLAKENESGDVYQVNGKQPLQVMHCVEQEEFPSSMHWVKQQKTPFLSRMNIADWPQT